MERRKRRAEAERARREQHVLNRWIDRRAGPAHRCLTFKAWNDPYRSLVDVRGQIFRRGQQPQELLPAHARSWFTGPIPWSDPLIPGPLVVGPHSLLDLRITDYQKPPLLHISAAWRTNTRLQDLSDQLIRHRVRF